MQVLYGMRHVWHALVSVKFVVNFALIPGGFVNLNESAFSVLDKAFVEKLCKATNS